jgi:hypothetical protein
MKHIPFDPEAPLVFRCEIDPWPEHMAQDIFVFSIRLDLWNRSDIPVERPLILFPQLGLDIRVQPPMLIRPSVSGSRRVLACTASRALSIAPRGSLEACRILFTRDRAGGAISFTGQDGWRGGESMSDFRILCATGGANFPLRRVELVVDADLLRAALNAVFAPDEGEPQSAPGERARPTLLALSA